MSVFEESRYEAVPLGGSTVGTNRARGVIVKESIAYLSRDVISLDGEAPKAVRPLFSELLSDGRLVRRLTYDVSRSIISGWVIRSFANRDVERIFNQERVRRFQAFERVALRRLLLLNQARSLSDLRGIGLGLETLKGDRLGQHSIRINKQYRVCFVWRDGDAFDVEIIDYH